MNVLPITGDLVRALGWTILHSLWQAFFIYACLRIVLKLWPQASARIKYNLALLSLSGIFVWFLITLYEHLDALSTVKTMTMQLAAAPMPVQPVNMPAVYPSQEPLMWLFPNLEMCFPIVVMLYAAGMIVMTIKLVSDLFELQHIRHHNVVQMDEVWEKHLETLAARLQIPRKVRLFISPHVMVPVMLGFLKPVILLPVAMVNNLSEQQLEAILLHELAHIKRNDYLLNIFQSIVEIMLFFNPFVWLIAKTIRLEREHCCDDLVIASTVQPLHYARALVALEEYRLTANPLSMAAADNRQHLFYRIKRIMEMKTTHLNYSQRFLAGLIIAAGLISIAWLNPAKGANEKARPETQLQAVDTHPADAAIIPAVATVNKPHTPVYVAAVMADTITPAPVEPSTPPTPPTPPTPATPTAPITPDTPETPNDPEDVIQSPANKQQAASDEKIDRKMIKQHIRETREQVRQAMKQMRDVDLKNIQSEVDLALASVDWKQLSADMKIARDSALSKVNWHQINQDIKIAYNKADWDKINENVNRTIRESKSIADKARASAMAQISRAQREQDRSQTDARRQKADIARAKADAARERADASREAAEIQREKNNGAPTKEMVRKMTAEKLINPSQGFTIEKSDAGLFINGTKQPAAVVEKYKQYLQHKKISIRGSSNQSSNDSNDELHVSIEN
ncbi:M56 family metallopeptidase [Chitinophaga nivalis]|uniref:M56 family metallopeptidase n=1 Tax=Chitinophaga nivalis TaxID=2991709 RepID=A0ABT3IPT4_9BACT|nr:M56 family metallopeptidase [Chitinophaga nivalis]MCW3464341.1 M56 family metallopeptidase [Chitinophaga nivalis]MCW3485968.1 M56 family metallopeptidase [Chitinophaga nivalis]